jgi:predicted AAA+ superfamily ATPase
MTSFPRGATERVRRLARHFPAVVLTGARQVGKTTLLRTAFPEHRYVTLDVPAEAALAENDPAGFLGRHPEPLLVDEVQYAPALFRHLKVAIDAKRRLGRILLTGSQKLTLMRGVTESLAGRAGVLELEALSAEEIRAVPRAAARLRDATEVLARGFMPALWADLRLPPHEFHASYVATYLERDLRQLVEVRSLRDFDRFLRLCAARNGQLLNKTDLARDVGVTTKTVQSWLAALEATGQITLLTPYFVNVGKRLTKTPKLYFHDPGLVAYLIGLDQDTLGRSPSIGALWETLVFAELRKILAQTGRPAALHFYREHEGSEVDFVIDRGGALSLIECKWTELPDERDALRLEAVASRLLDASDRRAGPLTLACRTAAPFPVRGTVRAVHGLELGERVA